MNRKNRKKLFINSKNSFRKNGIKFCKKKPINDFYITTLDGVITATELLEKGMRIR